MKRWISGIFALLCVFAFTGCSGTTTSETEPSAVEAPTSGKKVAYIMQMAPSDIFQTWSQSAQETAEGLGMEYDAFFCDGSDEQWQETVAQCAADGYDGLLLSHGGESYAYSFLTDLMADYPDLKIVTFDTQFKDSDGQTQTLEGVTQFFQQDTQLAQQLLEYVCQELYPEKTEAGEPVQILKVWEGPGYLTPFDRRQEGYAAYEEAGLIQTVETIAPSDLSNPEASMAEVTAATLAKYQPGDIDAIWCCYDLYANGVYTALTEGGYDIPLVSADLCDGDIEKMAAEGSPWKACATTNWSYNGEFGMRVLALELSGDLDAIIDPMTGEPSNWLELPATVITQDMVSGGDITMENLDTVAGEAYTDRSWMPTTDWMAALLGD
ncbi:substrate-binding domain-containing protein [Anaerotignum lactatifermentans]|uniref:Substrate-binding domain-containing protein n=1 Tax=Anaerotignum lactatifermentans TaxID=160404 RepID=A0ABS2G9I2_9FIRM|nr:substrate-binding domain-containing protein [Anaerotignum lactatifermentans]MBM6829577.1 substrate-binding domain-containing protein [Anaerotignum lactatifermentans]MBM6878071.1 substrate-binding domain-containing protein [Anaerotignum lactatifermentans]MBM6951099.1 substrate-binding domain-containing protein [Anaerotignum lactatifermentans]